ncbi:MAG: MgtC/SapB family protein [Aquihabitans sp.]
MDWSIEPEALGRILLAAGLGLAIGFERERDGHPAGTRTFAAVALGAALFGLVSTTGFDQFVAPRADTNVQIDVTRVASQVVVGIGFLGAGVIFRHGGQVQHLTTAATLWLTAAVGLSAGVGDAGDAVAVTVVALVLLALLPPVLKAALEVGRRPQQRLQFVLRAGAGPDDLRRLIDQDDGVEVASWRMERRDGAIEVRTELKAADERILAAAVDRLMTDPLADTVVRT